MEESTRERVCDIVYEMRGLAATLMSAAHGDLIDADRIIEYASAQVSRMSDELADAISDRL